MDRRKFLQAIGVGALAVPALGAAGFSGSGPASAAPEPLGAAAYRHLVPEIFRTPPSAPAHSDTLVIGSGFGAAITALRLTQAGTSVTMLERGSRWPIDPWRRIHASEALPDGRATWFRDSVPFPPAVPLPVDRFGGVLDVTDYPGISVWRAAAVGGGSTVFSGVMIEPEKRFFSDVFGSSLSYDEMHREYYPRVRSELRLDPLPQDLYRRNEFRHSRVWDEQARRAGYRPERIDGIWNWDVIRRELAGTSRPSAILGESTFGNSNGAKFDLRQNYLRNAEASGKLSIHPGHRVKAIRKDRRGYAIDLDVMLPTGEVLASRTITADRLFLVASSIGTSELLVKAQADGSLPNLNEHIGEGWGTNGDGALIRGPQVETIGRLQTAMSASRLVDESGMPVSLENWYVPGMTLGAGLLCSLGMTLDPRRARFRYVPSSGKVTLDWPAHGNDDTIAALRAVHNRIAQASGVGVGVPGIIDDVTADFTAHPLGGAVLGKATDSYGRVHGHDGLYVVDGALIPGSTGTVNPSLTISALAERNIERIVQDRR